MRFILIFALMLITYTALAFRIPSPPTFTLPWDETQITQLNDFALDVWNLTQGEYNFDIVTTTKTNADNGDLWLISTPPTVYIQYKANNHIFTITPDGF